MRGSSASTCHWPPRHAGRVRDPLREWPASPGRCRGDERCRVAWSDLQVSAPSRSRAGRPNQRARDHRQGRRARSCSEADAGGVGALPPRDSAPKGRASAAAKLCARLDGAKRWTRAATSRPSGRLPGRQARTAGAMGTACELGRPRESKKLDEPEPAVEASGRRCRCRGRLVMIGVCTNSRPVTAKAFAQSNGIK